MELNDSEKNQIIKFSKKYGLNSNQLINNFYSGNWSTPIKNFPLNSQGNLFADTSLRFSRNKKNKLQVDFSPKQSFAKQKIVDLDASRLTSKNPISIEDAGKEFSITIDKSQISGTLLEDNGKLKFSIDGYYGPKIDQQDIDKGLKDEKNIKIDQKHTLTDQQIKNGFTSHKNGQIKTNPSLDPVVQTQLLINNLTILMKLGVGSPILLEEQNKQIDQELNKKNNPMLKLTAQEKDELRAYINGQKKSHNVAVGTVMEHNQVSKTNSQAITFSQEDINNVKAYIGGSSNQEYEQKFKTEFIDAYIVSLREMMQKNAQLPEPVSEQLRQEVLKTLDTKSTFVVHERYNLETTKQLGKGEKSSHKLSIGLPKQKSKGISV